jgi:radical SAM protein with 4Fe4S-binding SPASM domain
MERGILPYEARLNYLENPDVEYFSFPKFMALESSRLCNLRCTMCVTHSDFIDHSHLEKYPKHFDLAKYKWILDQMEPYREYMSIAPQFQGEPFMAPQINEMISYARRKGFCVGFTSNATLWNEKVVDFLIDEEVNNLCVSLDGATKETYEAVRIGANFDTVVSNLNKLVERKMERGSVLPWLAINMTLMPENRHQQEQMLDEWLGKAYLVSINNTCINHVVPEKFHQPERYPCPFLWEGVHILTNGDVIACCRDSDYEEVMGNSFVTPILEIWNGSKYRHFRTLHATKRWNEIPICARCDTWMCKTKKTFGDGDRMVFQYPFYRQYQSLGNATGSDAPRNALDEVWGALKGTTKKITNTLISLNPLRRNAS